MSNSTDYDGDVSPSDSGWLIAVDGGGTKIAVTAHYWSTETSRPPERLDADRTWIQPGTGSAHPATWPQASVNLARALDQAILSIGSDQPVKAIYLALAGAGRIEDQQRVTQWLRDRLVDSPAQAAQLFCSGDIDPLLHFAPSQLLPGNYRRLAIILGTGSVVAALDGADQMVRAGGWGPMLGDEASGGALGLAALQLITRRLDSRQETAQWSELEQAVVDSLRRDYPQTPLANLVIETAADRTRRARLSLLVVQRALEQGDVQALQILEPQVEALVWQIEQVAQQILRPAAQLVLLFSGGLIERCPLLLNKITTQCQQRGLLIAGSHLVAPLLAALARAIHLTATRHTC